MHKITSLTKVLIPFHNQLIRKNPCIVRYSAIGMTTHYLVRMAYAAKMIIHELAVMSCDRHYLRHHPLVGRTSRHQVWLCAYVVNMDMVHVLFFISETSLQFSL
jgi:hypothetical protein